MTFDKVETPIFGGTGRIVRYRHKKFEINATRQGICIVGEDCPIISDQADLEILAETIAKAWQHYGAMKGENGISLE